MNTPAAKPLISVVMPAYNHEAYVAEAIQSVLSQTLQNLELIIVNDGSTDDTGKVILGFDDARIRYFHQSNRGAHHALNRGIALAQGDYIAIINSDDVYLNNRLEIMLDVLQCNNLDFVISDINLIDEHSEVINDSSHWWLTWHEDLKQKFQRTPSPVAALLAGNYAISSSNFFFRAPLVEKIGGFRPFRYILDYDYVFRAALINPPAFSFLLQQKLLNYRLHSRNTIMENRLLANIETRYFLKKAIGKYFGCELNIPVAYLSKVDNYIKKIQSAHCTEKMNSARHRYYQLNHQYQQINHQYDQLGHQHQQLSQLNDQLHDRNFQLAQELALYHNSTSYRIGRMITAPYRWVKSRWPR
ncbi:MAG: glycosyltransferase [Betaproteobacteria bacterium]|nr:glycosyltransferase [Betaproteobacteria bacterium]